MVVGLSRLGAHTGKKVRFAYGVKLNICPAGEKSKVTIFLY